MSSFGAQELLIVLAIVLLILGPKRLPSLGRQLGGGMREFRKSLGGSHDKAADEDDPVPSVAPVNRSAPGSEPVDGEPVVERRNP